MQSAARRPAGIEFPPVVFGSSCLGNLFAEYSASEKLAVSQAWFEHAKRPVFIDSAGKYGAGLALEVLGRNLSELGVSPDEVVISNKLGWLRQPLVGPEPTFEPGAWIGIEHDARQAISHDGILQCWEEGNALLGDAYQARLLSVHDPDEYLNDASDETQRHSRWQDLKGAYEALAELRAAGKADGIGVGSKDWSIVREIDGLVDLDWVMIANSFTIYRHPPELLRLIESFADRGVAVINSAVFHAGFLVGGEYFDYRRVSPDNPVDQERFAWRDRFHMICAQHDVEPAAACLGFARSPRGVMSLAINSSRPERIGRDVAAIEESLPTAFWDAMKSDGLIDPAYPYV